MNQNRKTQQKHPMTPASMDYHDEKTRPLHTDAPTPPDFVHVIAPARLPAGYQFLAEVQGCDVKVIVPEGGVARGDIIKVPLVRPEKSGRLRLKGPKGRWKDGLFGCCNYGCCHPHLWCAIFCPYVLMAQVMTRMRLTWTGEHGWYRPTLRTYKCVLFLVLFYVTLMVSLIVAEEYLHGYAPAKVRRRFRDYFPVAKVVATVFFCIWAIYALCMTRENVRVHYSIRQKAYYCGCEDLCCSVCCTCCTVAQLARHTGDYETYSASCCGESGHASEGPLFV